MTKDLIKMTGIDPRTFLDPDKVIAECRRVISSASELSEYTDLYTPGMDPESRALAARVLLSQTKMRILRAQLAVAEEAVKDELLRRHTFGTTDPALLAHRWSTELAEWERKEELARQCLHAGVDRVNFGGMAA